MAMRTGFQFFGGEMMNLDEIISIVRDHENVVERGEMTTYGGPPIDGLADQEQTVGDAHRNGVKLKPANTAIGEHQFDSMLSWFEFSHLPDSLQEVSREFSRS
jgi:hypothetical protein